MANPWIAGRQHEVVLVISFVVAIWGISKSFFFGSADAFSRSGSIIAIIGSYAVFIGYRHQQSLRRQQAMFSGKDIAEASAQQDDTAQTRSAYVVFTIAAAGTLIWAYGDYALNPLIAYGLRNDSLPAAKPWVWSEPTFLGPSITLQRLDLRFEPQLVHLDLSLETLRYGKSQVTRKSVRKLKGRTRRSIK